MDLAKRIAQWREQPPEQWARAANRYLPGGVGALLVLLIAYELAELTWALVPQAPLDAPGPVVAPSTGAAGQSGPAFDISQIAAAHLFGEASAEPTPVPQAVVDAPDTTLNLQLTGIVAVSGQGRDGIAIIAGARNQERKYVVGQTIEDTSGVQLHTVYADRVILNRGGQLETLRLPKELVSRAAPAGAGRPMPPMAAAGGSLREVISDNASRITDIVRVAPHIDGGQMVGFRVNPGPDREAFTALGLEPGDVITDINGMLLDDPSRGLDVFETLGEATMANVTVLRNGTPQAIVIDTSQLESLTDQRQ